MYNDGNIFDIYRMIGRRLPFRVKRCQTAYQCDPNRILNPDSGRLFLVEKVEPKGRYGRAFGKCFVDGKPNDSYRQECYPNIKDEEIPCAGCGDWVLMDVPGVSFDEIFPIYKGDDIIPFSKKHENKTIQTIYQIDENYLHHLEERDRFFKIDYSTLNKTAKPNVHLLGPDFVIDFGKFKGKTVYDIYCENFSYLDWIESQNPRMRFDWNALETRYASSGLPSLPKHGEQYKPNDVVQFGKYKGKTIFDIYCLDSIYLFNMDIDVDWFVLDKLFNEKELFNTTQTQPFNPLIYYKKS